jgi:endo-1,4-beta-mannosidase
MRFLVGVNYWPRSSAMAMWSRFDLGEIDEDLARMASLGFQVVRFFVDWENFQPEPDMLDVSAAERFLSVLDRIDARGLRALPTLFSGHMSGVNFIPPWALEPGSRSERFRTYSGGRIRPEGIGDFYTGELLEAQRFFVRELGERSRDHAAILAWDLGNEFSNLRAPRTPEEAEHWSAALAHDLFESSNVGATAGIHGEDITLERNIRPSSLCEPLKFATMHGYPAYTAFARSPGDPEVVPFLYNVTASCSHKRVFFSEFGTPLAAEPGQPAGPIPGLDEAGAATYAREVLERLHARGALGAMWWCWTDYDPALATLPPFDGAPHELHFGILRADGSERPVAKVLSEFARERRPVADAPAPILSEGDYYAHLPDSPGAAFSAYVETQATAAASDAR